MKNVFIRGMIRKDMNDVCLIERGSFAEPWSEEDFCIHLRDIKTLGMVAECGEHVLAYAIYSFRDRRVVIERIAVDPVVRYQGIGSAVLRKLMDKLDGHKRTRVTIDVPERLVRAQMWLKKNGFMCERINKLKGYDDIYRFVYRICGDSEVAVWNITQKNRISEHLDK